jgi:DNA-binding transcriptional LysR family regulator
MRGTQFAELNAFVAVAEHGNFTKAATHLAISPATLSQTIRELEERLGVRLLNRTTRSVALTEAGERLLARLRPVLDDYEAAIDSVNGFRDKPAGLIRLTMPPVPATWLVRPSLPRFLAARRRRRGPVCWDYKWCRARAPARRRARERRRVREPSPE